MSDSQEAKNEKRARQRAQALIDNATADKVWSFDEVKQVVNAGLQLPAGTRITAPKTMADFYAMDLGSGASPNETMGLQDYLNNNQLTLQQYVEQTQSQPFKWNNDGSVTYDPAYQKVAYEHTPASHGRNLKIGLGLFAALTGAGLAGIGQGAATAGATGGSTAGAAGVSGASAAGGGLASEFALVPAGSGAGLGGVGTSGLGLGTAGSSIGLTPGLATAGGTALSGGAIGAAANTLAGAAGVGALSSIPTTAQLASMLGTTPSLAQQAMDIVRSMSSKPGVTSQAISSAIKGATGLEVSPETVGGLAKIGIAAAALGGGSGGGSNLNGTAASQTAAANDAMGLAREQWEWNKARAEELLPQQKELIQQQIDIGKLSADRARSEWDIYNDLYLPAEKQYVEKMTNWDTPDRRTERIQSAVADVSRGYDAAGGTLDRNLLRSGVKPGGAGYVQAMTDLTRARAADTAGATNNTRRQVENEGIAGLERVTNIGRGRPSTSFAADQLALTAGNSANANTNQNTATTNAGLSSAQGWFNTGVNALNSAASVQNAAQRNQQTSSAGVGKLLSDLFSGGFADGGLVRRGARARQPMGYADGGLVRRAERKLQKHLGPAMNMRMGYADGGLIRGPGTTTSDSIPATIDGQEPTSLSTGEAVLNAEAVQIVGEQFVENINAAGLERRQRRGGGQVIEGEARRIM